MQNLKKNWVVVWKMTWKIWQIFPRVLKSLKIGILMGSFYPKEKMCELKIYRGVMCHDNEEWCKIWRGPDMSFQNWQEEFDKFWREHSKVSKICTLMVSFWPKKSFDLKKCREIIFHDTEAWYKIWRKTDPWFGKWHEEFAKFHQSTWNSQN